MTLIEVCFPNDWAALAGTLVANFSNKIWADWS